MATVRKDHFGASETGKCSKYTKLVQILKIFIFKSFFYTLEQKIDLHNLCFRIFDIMYFQIILVTSQRDQFGASETGKC